MTSRSPTRILATVALVAACTRAESPRPDSVAESATASTARAESAAIAPMPATPSPGDRGRFPLVGIAVRDTAMRWCVALPPGPAPLRQGEPVALVFATRETSTTWLARLGPARARRCHTEFGQPRWEDYRFHDLTVHDTSAGPAQPWGIALAVLSDAQWGQLGDGRVIADLDGDGNQEEARKCSADEGHHFTIWSFAADGTPRRRAHEYFDWGALVERTCRAGEDGTDGAP